MFGFLRFPIPLRSRFKTLRRLYCDQNTPEARGLRLLRRWLSRSQFEQFDAEGHFDVIGSVTGRKYRIEYGTSMNVYELGDTGRLKVGWCFMPQGCLVAGDVMLAQKIALETFESRVLLVGGRFSPMPGPH
jgi:hypothetical protein